MDSAYHLCRRIQQFRQGDYRLREIRELYFGQTCCEKMGRGQEGTSEDCKAGMGSTTGCSARHPQRKSEVIVSGFRWRTENCR